MIFLSCYGDRNKKKDITTIDQNMHTKIVLYFSTFPS